MERRRFVPSAEGLEGRQLLSSSPYGRGHRPNLIPLTFQQKTVRIDRLPATLRAVENGRQIPEGLVTQLQADLTEVRGKLHAPRPVDLNEFNKQERAALRHASFSHEASRALNVTFDRALEGAGATPAQVGMLQEDMDKLVKVDVADRKPVQLASNDYAIVLQTALGVGRPIRTPKTPVLTVADRAGGDPHVVTRGVLQPHLIGTYDPNTQIDLLNQDGTVIGTTTSGITGHYVVRPGTTLGDGTYTFRVRAIDAGGDTSAASDPLVVTIDRSGHGTLPKGPMPLTGGSR